MKTVLTNHIELWFNTNIVSNEEERKGYELHFGNRKIKSQILSKLIAEKLQSELYKRDIDNEDIIIEIINHIFTIYDKNYKKSKCALVSQKKRKLS